MTPEQKQILENSGYSMILDRPGDKWIGLTRFMFTWAVIGGPLRDAATGYSDRWCYKSYSEAFTALVTWAANGFEGEPIGWIANKSAGAKFEHPWEETA